MEIYIYDGSRSMHVNAADLAQYVRETLRKVTVEVRRDIVLRSPESLGRVASDFARSKVLDSMKRGEERSPLPGEILYEENRMKNAESPIFGNIYNGLIIQESLKSLLPREEVNLRSLHIVITNQLLATWDEGDMRYHLRAGIYGIPNVISTTGLAEAPAKPREYYFIKQGIRAGRMSQWVQWDDSAEAALAEEFKDRMIQIDDPRLTEILKGYVMQAVFYHMTGDPFCSDGDCRLFNAHWQEELLRAQIAAPEEFCPRHRAMVENMRNDTWRRVDSRPLTTGGPQ